MIEAATILLIVIVGVKVMTSVSTRFRRWLYKR